MLDYSNINLYYLSILSISHSNRRLSKVFFSDFSLSCDRSPIIGHRYFTFDWNAYIHCATLHHDMTYNFCILLTRVVRVGRRSAALRMGKTLSCRSCRRAASRAPCASLADTSTIWSGRASSGARIRASCSSNSFLGWNHYQHILRSYKNRSDRETTFPLLLSL